MIADRMGIRANVILLLHVAHYGYTLVCAIKIRTFAYSRHGLSARSNMHVAHFINAHPRRFVG